MRRLLAGVFSPVLALIAWCLIWFFLILWPAVVLILVSVLFGTESSVFTFTLLICALWVYFDYRRIRKAAGGGRTTRKTTRRTRKKVKR